MPAIAKDHVLQLALAMVVQNLLVPAKLGHVFVYCLAARLNHRIIFPTGIGDVCWLQIASGFGTVGCIPLIFLAWACSDLP